MHREPIVLRAALIAALSTALLASCDGGRAVPLDGGSDGGAGPAAADRAFVPRCDTWLPFPDLRDPCPASWSCAKGSFGQEVCRSSEAANLPRGLAGTTCHVVAAGTASARWTCSGTLTTAGALGGCGWQCAKMEGGLVRCERAVSRADFPPQASFPCLPESGPCFACARSERLGGTQCEALPKEKECFPGQLRWCAGLSYGPIGVVKCLPDGKWETINTGGGMPALACYEYSDARVPATHCACYHYYFNPICCERPDCVVPDGEKDKPYFCKSSAGQLCDPCWPSKPSCVEPGAKCLVTNQHETFCGRPCASEPCPAGYLCLEVKSSGGSSTMQCAPDGYSCYFK
jgi:hypothetical protein